MAEPPARLTGVDVDGARERTGSGKRGEVMANLAVAELLPEIEHRESPSVAEVAGMSLERFARAGLVVKVRSSLLDEVVLFASDNARLAKDERRTVYRAADLDRLLRG